MHPKKFSIILAALIWSLVGLRIASRGYHWIEIYFKKPDWHLFLLIFSLLIALMKANTVLKKAVLRNLSNLDKIPNKIWAYFFGWIILYNKKGLIFISLMIGLGIGLRYLREFHNADPYNIFGFIYLGIGLALIRASLFYFEKNQI